MRIARLYMRVSTEEQELARQEHIEKSTRAAGYYIAGIYREKASGARVDRPELQRMIGDLQQGDVVIAERLDRISRLPLQDAEKLIDQIRGKGAKLSIPGVVDLSELVDESEGTARIVLKAIQDMLLRIALQAARDDYEERRARQAQGVEIAKAKGKYKGRQPDAEQHATIVALRSAGRSIAETAKLARCSESQVKRVWRLQKPTN